MVSRQAREDFENADQHHLWALLGQPQMALQGEAKRQGIRLVPVGVRSSGPGSEFLIAVYFGVSDVMAKQRALRGLVSLISATMRSGGVICPVIKFCSYSLTGTDIGTLSKELLLDCVGLPNLAAIPDAWIQVSLDSSDTGKVLEWLEETGPDYFAETVSCGPGKSRSPGSWESAQYQTSSVTDEAVEARMKARAGAMRQRRRGGRRVSATQEAQRIAESIEDYLQARPDRYYRPRLPSGWRPVVPRTSDNCEVLKELAVKAKCGFISRNPVEEIETTYDKDGFTLHKAVIVGIGDNLITSHDDRDERTSNNFTAHGFKAGGKVRKLDKKLMHDLLDSPPVVWSKDGHAPYYVLSGNKNIISFRRSGDWLKKSEYFDAVQSIPFKDGHQRGFLVLVLEGDPTEYLNYLGFPVPVSNPMLMVPRKNPVLMVGNPSGRGHYVSGVRGAARGQVPTDELPDGAVPLDQVPDSVKNDPSFKKSMEMFKKRYGGYPDYAIQAKVPSGMPPALCGIGQIKQLDYWAADNVKEAGNWTHWFHEAGERGGNKAWTRAGLLAADPYTGRPIMGEQKGVDMKFTPRGIVG